MDKREQAQLDMERACRDVLRNAAYAAAVSAVPALDDGVDALAASITVIETLDVERMNAAKGDTGTKKTARAELTKSAFAVDGILTAYAAKTGDNDLLGRVNHEKSDFVRSGEEDYRTLCQFLLQRAKGYDADPAKPLAPYNLSALKIGTFESRLNLFMAVFTRPTNLAQYESTVVKLIDDEFAKQDRLIELVIDPLMRQFEEENPRFYEAYRQARVINDPASHPAKPAPAAPPTPAAPPASAAPPAPGK